MSNNKSYNTGRNKSRPWTATDIALLRDMYTSGRSIPFISDRLDRNPRGASREVP